MVKPDIDHKRGDAHSSGPKGMVRRAGDYQRPRIRMDEEQLRNGPCMLLSREGNVYLSGWPG